MSGIDANDVRRQGLPLVDGVGEPMDVPGTESDEELSIAANGGGRRKQARKELIVTEDWDGTIREGVRIINDDRGLHVFQRGGRLVRIVRESWDHTLITMPPNAPRIEALSVTLIGALLTKLASLVKIHPKTGELVAAHPPPWLLKGIHEQKEWPTVPPLAGVSEQPLFRPDGTILMVPGYDLPTGLIFEPRWVFPAIPERPTCDDAIAARALLESVIKDFPFAGPEHRSGWLAFVLTLVARYSFEGPTPLFLADASTAGSGKTLLATIAAVIATGFVPIKCQLSGDEEERRKSITSLAMMGPRAVLFDNLIGELGGAALCDLLTSTQWSDRKLSKNYHYSGPWLSVCSATGNNVTLGQDMHRRVVHMRLEPRDERPEQRTDFEHRDLLAWVQREQPHLLGAALTLLRAYSVAGRPSVGLEPWGSYGGWSDAVRAPLVWAGAADPAAARVQLTESASLGDATAARLVSAWKTLTHVIGKCTAGRALKAVYPSVGPYEPDSARDPFPLLREAIEELAALPASQRVSSKSLGRILAAHRGRVFGGLQLRSANTADGLQWYVTAAGPSPPPPNTSSEPSE